MNQWVTYLFIWFTWWVVCEELMKICLLWKCLLLGSRWNQLWFLWWLPPLWLNLFLFACILNLVSSPSFLFRILLWLIVLWRIGRFCFGIYIILVCLFFELLFLQFSWFVEDTVFWLSTLCLSVYLSLLGSRLNYWFIFGYLLRLSNIIGTEHVLIFPLLSFELVLREQMLIVFIDLTE